MVENKDDEPGTAIVKSTPAEIALDAAAAVASLTPILGGAMSNILSGLASDRRMDRVIEVIEGIGDRVRELSSESSEYVQTEDFEDLLSETLSRVHRERSEEKRRLYRDFLIDAIQSPGAPYDEQLRFVRTLEELQPDHIRVLKAFMQRPDPSPPYSIGSIGRTLADRLPGIEENRLMDLAGQLVDMKLVAGSLSGMMTASGAQDLRSRITAYGKRFTRFLEDD